MAATQLAAKAATLFSGALDLNPMVCETVHGFAPWKDFVHDHFPWLEHRNNSLGDFQAQVSAYRTGIGALTTICADASEVIRTRHLAEATEEGFIKLMWQMSGKLQIEQDERQCSLAPGQAAVLDTARPYRISLSEGAHFAVLMLPHDSCPGWQRISQKICGARIGQTPSIRAALGALMALSGTPSSSDAVCNETVIQAVQQMLSSSLHHTASELGIDTNANPKLERAQRHIEQNIGNPGLDANDLASALCMSRRSLYLMFKQYQITPGKMIHDIRLEQIRQVLEQEEHRHRKITDIALDAGFGDYATFSRLFKKRFGVTPSEYRLRMKASHH
tara:strand:+ start:1734 stop:2732 length:999 start_codon:yes stop_codon:yes gene_type:complete